MKTYIDHDGKEWVMGQRSELAQDLYADLVAAINIATQLQAEVKRLEAMLENAGDTCHELQENNDALRVLVLRLRAEATQAKYYAVQA